MNIERPQIESLDTPNAQQSTQCASEPMPEITPLALETFKLIGGGSSVVVI